MICSLKHRPWPEYRKNDEIHIKRRQIQCLPPKSVSAARHFVLGSEGFHHI